MIIVLQYNQWKFNKNKIEHQSNDRNSLLPEVGTRERTRAESLQVTFPYPNFNAGCLQSTIPSMASHWIGHKGAF